LTRFLLFAFTSLLLLIALFNLGVELVGAAPDLGPMIGWREGRPGLPGAFVLASWALESLALTALFVLVDGDPRSRWLSGLLTGWMAWVFRGPLLVLAAAGFGRLAAGPWWRLSLRWFLLYTLAGLLLALVARLTAGPEADAQPAPPRTTLVEPAPGGPAIAPAPGDALATAPEPEAPPPPPSDDRERS
jgi:hypothetical protein